VYGPAWQRAIRDAERATIAAAGHLAELEQPDRFATLVREFLRREPAAAVA
jgi:pimeloyl-ACP methyl ester carboxylesterase